MLKSKIGYHLCWKMFITDGDMYKHKAPKTQINEHRLDEVIHMPGKFIEVDLRVNETLASILAANKISTTKNSWLINKQNC